jgi:hypothetical protein
MMIPQAMETARPSAPIAVFMPIALPVLVMPGLLPPLVVAVELLAAVVEAEVEVEVLPLVSCKYKTVIPSGHHKIKLVKASTNSERSTTGFVPAVDGGISICRGRWFSRNKASHA